MAKLTYEVLSGSFMQPAWATEPIGPQNMIPGGAQVDPTMFSSSDAFTVTVTSAETASPTATIAVEPIDGSIPAGYTLNFGAGKYATLNSVAAIGTTSLDASLTSNLIGTETALFPGVSGKKFIPAGTLVGRTYAERDAGIRFGPYASGDEEVYLLAFDTPDAAINPECELLRHQTLVRDHLLPGWVNLPTDNKTIIRNLYQCVRGPVVV